MANAKALRGLEVLPPGGVCLVGVAIGKPLLVDRHFTLIRQSRAARLLGIEVLRAPGPLVNVSRRRPLPVAVENGDVELPFRGGTVTSAVTAGIPWGLSGGG